MKLKNRYILIIILAMIQVLNCGGADKGMFYRAVERADVDIAEGRAGLIRTVYCDIYIEYVDKHGWNYLKKTGFFKGKGKGDPVNPCFHYIIVNTWNKPFVVDKIEILYNGEVFPSENFSFIKDRDYLENRYSLNISSLMKKRRILSDRNLLNEIDFENDTVEYRLNFVAPGDKVSFFNFFERIPSDRNSKIRISIKYNDMKKVIDFDIGRFEYNEIENMM